MQAARAHRGETIAGKQKTKWQAASVALCRVSYVDVERVRHEVQVDADSLYEAIAKAVHHFRAGLWHGNPPGPGCEFDVQIWREHPVSYKIWASSGRRARTVRGSEGTEGRSAEGEASGLARDRTEVSGWNPALTCHCRVGDDPCHRPLQLTSRVVCPALVVCRCNRRHAG
jgi:hypothetical protein